MTYEQNARKLECELSFEYFTRYFFKVRYGQKMIIAPHHKIFFSTIHKIISGDIKRLIVNVPPGYTKSEIFVISFIAWGLALNPQSRFMHLSASDALALENSSKTREIINTEEYKSMWNIEMKDDSDSKKKWWTKQTGGMYAGSAGGQVTGFRAGHMHEGFTGALIIDDPIKPDDAFTVELEKVNQRINNTVKSRLAREDVPIILIMQRIHKDDPSGYLLSGGTQEKWHHLNLPVYITPGQVYDTKLYPYGVPIEHNLKRGWLWEAKHNESHKNSLMSHKLTFFSQYMQQPEKIDIEGALWRQDIIDRYRIHELPPKIQLYKVMGLDPSGDDGKSKTADMIGNITVGTTGNGEYYVLHDDTANGSPSEWATKAIQCYNKHEINIIVYEKNFGGAMIEHTIRSVEGGKFVRMIDVVASKGKLVRAEPVSALYEQGKVHHVGYFAELESELCTYNGNGKSPNRLDALVWALTHLIKIHTKPIHYHR